MTDIEQKALALVHEAGGYRYTNLADAGHYNLTRALLRAIEQREAFQQEVSDAVELAIERCGHDGLRAGHINEYLHRFIIAKPDPLVAVIATALREGSPFCEDGSHSYMDEAKVVAAAIKKRGGKIVWETSNAS